MMHRLFLAFYPFSGLDQDEGRVFYETYQALQDGTNPLYAYMGLRYFELGLEIFMRQGIQIVFMRSPLSDVIERLRIDPLDIEPFTELFTDSVVYVGPYDEADARRMLNELVQRNNRPYESYALDFLLWATGRYAGLIRSGFRALETLGHLDANTVMTRSEQIVHELALKRSVRTECKTIWKSLTDAERSMLREFALNAKPNIDTSNLNVQQVFALLEQKRLLRVQGNRVTIEPPVFYSFVLHNPDAEV
jgi:hypothetical protein